MPEVDNSRLVRFHTSVLSAFRGSGQHEQKFKDAAAPACFFAQTAVTQAFSVYSVRALSSFGSLIKLHENVLKCLDWTICVNAGF